MLRNSQNKPKNLQEAVAEVKKMIDYFASRVKESSNFAKDHVYYIDRKKADTTVTSVISEISDEKFSLSPKHPAPHLGNTFDRFVRAFFSDKGVGVNIAEYANLDKMRFAMLRDSLKSFNTLLGEEFGKGKYKVISDPFALGGKVKDSKGKTITVAGEPDLLVVTDTGDIYIYDMKAKADFTDQDIRRYSAQLNMYRKLIVENFPQFEGRIKDCRLLLAKVTYPSARNEGIKMYDKYEDEYGNIQILYDGQDIQDLSISEYNLELAVNGIGESKSYIYSLGLKSSVDALDVSALDYKKLPNDEKEGLGVDEADAEELMRKIAEIQKALDALDALEKGKEKGGERKSGERKSGKEKSGKEGVRSNAKPIKARIVLPGDRHLTSTEIIHLGQTLVKKMSFLIDLLFQTDTAKRKFLNYRRGMLDKYSGTSFTDGSIRRDEVLAKVPTLYDDLMGYIREVYFNTRYRPEDISDELFDKLTDAYSEDTFNEIKKAGKSTLLEIEGATPNGSRVAGIDQLDESVQNGESVEAMEADVPAFDIESNTISIIGTMDIAIKRILSMIPELDEEGNAVRDQFGIDSYYMNLQDVVQYLLANVRTLENSQQMMDKLDELTLDMPALGVIRRSIESNENADDLKAMFFRTFSKAQNNYQKSYIKYNTSTKAYEVVYRDLAQNTTSEKAFSDFKKSVIKGKSDLFKLADKSNCGNSTVDKNGLEELISDLDNIEKTKDSKKRAKKIVEILDRIGFNASADKRSIIAKMLSTKITRVSANGVESKVSGDQLLIYSIKSLFDMCERTNDKTRFIPFAKNGDNDIIFKSLWALNSTLSQYMTEKVEASGYDNHKTYQTYSNRSFLTDLVDRIAYSTSEDLDNYIENELKPYVQFYLGGVNKNDSIGKYFMGDSRESGFVSSWMNRFANASVSERMKFKRTVVTSYDRTAYKDLTDSQYATALFAGYFAPLNSGKSDLRQFRVPTMSDKNAFEYLQWHAYTDSYTMKKDITKESFNFFLYEIRRMRAILEQLANGDKSKDIEFFHIQRTKETIAIGERFKEGKMTMEDFRTLNNLSHSKKTANGMRFVYLEMFNGELAPIKTEDDEIKDGSYLMQEILNYFNTGEIMIEGVEKSFNSKFEYYMDGETEAVTKELLRLGLLYTEEQKAERKKAKLSTVDPLEKSLSGFNYSKFIDEIIEEYVWNDRLAVMNIFNLTMCDPAFAPTTVELQKRFSALHASTEKCDSSAQFFDRKKNTMVSYSDGKMRVVEIADSIVSSSLADELREVLAEKAKNAKDKHEKYQYELMRKTIPGMYEKFDMSDGQGFTTFTGYFKRMGMLGMMTPDIMKAFSRIREGNYDFSDINMVLQPIKPFVFTHIAYTGLKGDMSEIKAPYMIKNSEYLVMLAGAIIQGSNSHSKLAELVRAVESTHYNEDGSFKPDGIDTIIFHSNVKLGSSNPIDLSNASTADDIESAFSGEVKSFPYSDWGMQQRVPAHMMDEQQGMSSQARTIDISDVPEDFEIDIDGEHYDKDSFIKEYMNLISEDFRNGINGVIDLLNLNGTSAERKEALSNYLKGEVMKDSRYSADMYRAVSLDENGNFIGCIGDPSMNNRIQRMLYSLVKRKVNKEEMPGGFVVQACCYGTEGLKVETAGKGANKRIVKVHTYNTFPTAYAQELATEHGRILPMQELERRAKIAAEIKPIVFDEASHKFRSKDEIIALADKNSLSKAAYNALFRSPGQLNKMKDIAKALDYEMFNPEDGSARYFTADRIPGEDKYSTLPCFVDEFLAREGGECTMFPAELVVITNADYDIDKDLETWMTGETYSSYLNSDYTGLTDTQKRKNKIFKMQYEYLTHPASYDKILNPGQFDSFKECAKELTADDSAPSMMSLRGQLYFRAQNMLGKAMVAISALNGPSHTLGNIANIRFNFPRFGITVNGETHYSDEFYEGGYYRYDPTYSPFDGSRISKTINKFIGASADTAKDPILPKLNVTPATANIVFTMVRMGIPENIIFGMLRQPSIDAIVKSSGKSGEFTRKLNELFADLKYEDSEVLYTISKTAFDYESLKDNALKGKAGMGTDEDVRSIMFLKLISDITDKTRMITDITKLNSNSASAGPTHFKTLQTIQKIREFEEEVKENAGKGDAFFAPDVYDNIMNNVPYIKTLTEVYTDLIPKMMKPYFLEFSPEYTSVLDYLRASGLGSFQLNEDFQKKLFNAFLIFRGTMGSEPVLDMSYEHRKNVFVGTPLEYLRWDVDNEFLQSISFLPHISKAVKIPGLNMDTAALPIEQVDLMSASWQELVDNIDPTDSKKTRSMSDKLIEYQLFRYGFNFSPTGFLNLAPVAARNNFADYAKMLDAGISMKMEPIDISNFLVQFIRNNTDMKSNPLVAKLSRDEVKIIENQLKDFVSEEDLFYMDEKIAKAILGDKVAFLLNKNVYIAVEVRDGRAVFEKCSPLGFGNQGLEYNADTSEVEVSVRGECERRV